MTVMKEMDAGLETGSIDINSENYVKNKMSAAKLILEYPVLGGRLSAGTEYTKTMRTDNYLNQNDILPSTISDIDEYNTSVFMDYGRMTPIGMARLGIRYEHTGFEYSENGNVIESQSRKYDNLYPYMSLGTMIGKLKLMLEYATKTQRPKYSQLGNNISYGNRFTLMKGNPLLRPSVKKDMTLSGAYSFLQFMASYQHIDNDIVYCAEQMEDNPAVSVVSHKNADSRKVMTLYVMVSPKVSFWHLSLSASMLKQWFETQSNSVVMSMNKPIFQIKFNNAFELPGNSTVTVNAFSQSKGNMQNIYLNKNIFKMDLSVSKSFLKKRLNVLLEYNDIFHGQKDGNIVYNSLMSIYQYNEYDSRKVVLTLRYKINTAKRKYKGTGAGNDEKNRL